MKKIILFLLIFLIHSSVKSQVIPNLFFAEKEFPPKVLSYSDTIAWDTKGNAMIDLYTNGTLKILDANLKYFSIDAFQVLRYIATYESYYRSTIIDRRIHHISFILGKDGNDIKLFLLGLNEEYKPIYLPDGVLGNCLSCSAQGTDCKASVRLTGSPITLPPYTGMHGTNLFGKKFPPKRILTSGEYSTYTDTTTFRTIRSAYEVAAGEAHTQFSFDAGTLANYIYNTNGIQDLQLVLAAAKIDPTHSYITLVIVGTDASGNQLYLNNTTTPSVLEHCYPCPSVCAKLFGTDFFAALAKWRENSQSEINAIGMRNSLLNKNIELKKINLKTKPSQKPK